VVNLRFLGGTGTVTGSKFLLETGSSRVLAEAGLFQGLRELRRRNWAPFAVPPETLDAVTLTHAHLDHCGYLPRLARDGFTGPALASRWTAELAAIVLRDSAHLQEEDAKYAERKGFSKHAPPLPLYDSTDAERAIALLRSVPFGQQTQITDDVYLRFERAGHILGSAIVQLEVDGTAVVLSGDLGRDTHPILNPPAPPPDADVVLVESTYGDRGHEDPGEVLADAVRRTVARGGSVVIPAFAVDRTEILLHELSRLIRSGAIPDVPVYVDSPMALAALSLYREAIKARSEEIRAELLDDGDDPFDHEYFREAHTVEESKQLNDPVSPVIIVSASGMATGGRVVHHLAGMLPDPKHTVVLSGFQAVGTRGRDLLEGAQQLKMHGRYVRVRAEVVQLPGFSAHADADEIIQWLARAARPPETCFVVHGEEQSAEVLARRIQEELDWTVVVPRPGEVVRI
jgi:metallo-beta-lactamase family protein